MNDNDSGPNPIPPSILTPSLAHMAFSLTDALKDNLQQMVSRGALLAEQMEVSKRIDICMGCEFFVKNGERCNKCGCYMNIKARLQASKCPVGKW